MLLCSFLVSLLLVHLWCVDNALIKGEIEECEYSILLVMSELSTVRCDRALGLWIAGTRASSVDGELPSKDQAHDHTAQLTIHLSQAG